MMLAAMAVIGPCHGRSLRAAQHALLFQPAYLTGGKQIRDLAQVDLCWRTVGQDGECIGALAVVASRRRHVRTIFFWYRPPRHLYRPPQALGAPSFRTNQVPLS